MTRLSVDPRGIYGKNVFGIRDSRPVSVLKQPKSRLRRKKTRLREAVVTAGKIRDIIRRDISPQNPS